MANASGIKAGRAYVLMGMDYSPLIAGLKASEAKLKAFGSAVEGIGTKLAGAGLAIAAPFLAAAKKFADAGSELNDMSARTGVSVEALSELGHAAGQTGTDMATVEGAIRKMQKALVQGSEENIQAEATFAALGLSVQQLQQLSPEDQFTALAKEIGNIQSPTAKAGAAMQVFGKSGTALIPMIDDLAALTKEARDFGLVWTGEEAEKADALGDALDLLKATLGRVVTSVGSELAPLITEVATSMARAAKLAIDWAKANGPLLVSIFQAGVAITAIGVAVTALGITIAGAGAAFGVLATVVTILLNPITLVTAALAGLTTWFLTSTEAGGQALAWLGERFTELAATAVQAFGGIADALKAGDIALAGQILWAGLKVAWLEGINFIKGVTSEWLIAIPEGFSAVSFAIAGSFTKAWLGIQAGAIVAVGVIQDAFTNMVGYLQTSLVGLGGFFSKIWAQVKALFSGEDATGELHRIAEEVAKAKDDIAKGTGATLQGREQDRNKQLDALSGQGEGTLSALNDQQAAETDARRKAAADSLAAGADELKAAQDALSGLVGQAAKEAGAVQPVAARGKGGPEGDLSPENLDKSIKQAKAKVSVAGAFAASSVQGLGAGDTVVVAEKQLDEQKKTNGHLEKLNKKVDKKEAAFR